MSRCFLAHSIAISPILCNFEKMTCLPCPITETRRKSNNWIRTDYLTKKTLSLKFKQLQFQIIMTQNQAVIETIEMLGGVATLGEINANIFKIKECRWGTKTPFASIRRIVRHTDGLFRIKPGLYGLDKYRKVIEQRGIIVQTEANKDSPEVRQFTHYYYQGLLVTIGNLRNLQTYIPSQDKNRIFKDGRKLCELASLPDQPHYSYDSFVHRSSTIDVIWFNKRNMPHTFFEVEHSTDIQNSLLKFNDLQDFSARMVIVADQKRFEEFKSKMSYHAFEELKEHRRVTFLNYEELDKQYDMELARKDFRMII